MGSMPQISLDVTEKYKLPIPPKEEQERIVSILDRFIVYLGNVQSMRQDSSQIQEIYKFLRMPFIERQSKVFVG